jgi:hypothetical protein
LSPTILKTGPYRFFFNSREESRMHVHISMTDGMAKFWLEPIVALADYYSLSPQELRKMEEMVHEHQEDFKNAWRKHFSQ